MRFAHPRLMSWTVLATLFFAVPVMAQGETGFLRGQGKLDIAPAYSLDTYDEFWVGDDKVSDPGVDRITRHTANVYAAYGLTDELDLIGNIAWVWAESDGVFESEDGLQDMLLAVKWKPLTWQVGDGELSLLANPGVKFPLTHYEDDAVTAIGDGQTDLRLRGIAHYQLGGFYVSFGTGYDFRFDDPGDEFPLDVNMGITLGMVTLNGFYTRVDSLDGHDIGEGPFPGVEEDYDRIGGGVYVRINEWLGLTARAWTTIDGQNTGDVDGFSVGGVLKF